MDDLIEKADEEGFCWACYLGGKSEIVEEPHQRPEAASLIPSGWPESNPDGNDLAYQQEKDEKE